MKFQGKWMPDKESFREVCKDISKNLTRFKQRHEYASFIGNDVRNKETAEMFYEHIMQNYTYLDKSFDAFFTNDNVGNPITHQIGKRKMSVGTLRFIKVLGDILQFCTPKSIIEIGSGYGGQCKVTKDYLNLDYTLVDIPESLGVAEAYLKEFGIKPTLLSTDSIPETGEYDLVISDYCLGELDRVGIDFYMENIISKCHNAYVTVNDNDNTQYILESLKPLFKSVSFKEEEPKTSHHQNFIICAG